jgi:hypothetical protein
MEIVWVDRRDGNDRFYFALPKRMSKEQFFASAKVKPGTYAGRLIDRLYQNIFETSLELKQDYTVYYQLEYLTYYRYLRRRLLLSKEEAEIIAGCWDNSEIVIECKPWHYFLREDTGRVLLEQLLSDQEVK